MYYYNWFRPALGIEHCEYEIVQQATAANNLRMHLAPYEQRLALASQIYINSAQVIFKHQRIIIIHIPVHHHQPSQS